MRLFIHSFTQELSIFNHLVERRFLSAISQVDLQKKLRYKKKYVSDGTNATRLLISTRKANAVSTAITVDKKSTPSIKIPLKRSTSRYILNRFTVVSIPKEPSMNYFKKFRYVRFFLFLIFRIYEYSFSPIHLYIIPFILSFYFPPLLFGPLRAN